MFDAQRMDVFSNSTPQIGIAHLVELAFADPEFMSNALYTQIFIKMSREEGAHIADEIIPPQRNGVFENDIKGTSFHNFCGGRNLVAAFLRNPGDIFVYLRGRHTGATEGGGHCLGKLSFRGIVGYLPEHQITHDRMIVEQGSRRFYQSCVAVIDDETVFALQASKDCSSLKRHNFRVWGCAFIYLQKVQSLGG